MRTIRPVFRYGLILTVVLVLSVPLMMFAYSHAQNATPAQAQGQASTAKCAGHKGYTRCVKFGFEWWADSDLRDPGFGCCISVHYQLNGHVGYNVHVSRQPGAYFWTNEIIFNPVLTADVYIRDSSGDVAHIGDVSYLIMDQMWDGYGCSFNPTFTIAYPWGFALSGWPNCGNRTVADYPFDSHGSGSYFKEDNEKAPTRIGDYTGGNPPCYGIKLTSTFQERYSWGVKQFPFIATNLRKVCLPVNP